MPPILIGVLLFALNYPETIEQWRAQREARLKADDGWLRLAGLFWLKDGENRIGSAAGSAILLPRGPRDAGRIEYHAGTATIFLNGDAHATVNGKAVGKAVLQPDKDIVQMGDFTFFVIHRGQRDAIRLRDKHSEAMQEFKGLKWYPVNNAYRVEAKWVPYNPPKMLAIPNILGETEHDASPGYAAFRLNGQDLKLEPTVEGKELFFVFRDQTAGKTTYPAGRFLHTEMPQNGKVVLDFNKAYNPPCAFTPYATCPLPTAQNRMPIRLEAGELNYGHH